jgi:adenylate cyclase
MTGVETLRFEARDRFRVTPEALWPLISNTAKLNRALGMPPVEYTVVPSDGGGSHIEARARVLGIPLARWTEYPFRWEAPHGYTVVRELHGGPLRRVRIGVQLTPDDSGTEALIYTEFVPRNPLGSALVRRLGPASVGKVLQQCRLFERYLLGQSDNPFPNLAGSKELPTEARGAAEELVRRGLDQRGVELLRQHLAEAPDEDVVKMRPFELADRWGLDRRQTLALFLHATTAGLVTMTWDVLCPNCRVAKEERASLREVSAEAHCETCNIKFDATFDRSVEVRFSVAPVLRRVHNRQFCIGGPMNTPHVLAQASVPPGEVERLICKLAPGTYRVRAASSQGRALLDAVQDGRGTTDPSASSGQAPSASSGQAPSASSGQAPSASSGQAGPGATKEAPSEANSLAVAVTAHAIEPPRAEVPPGAMSLEVHNSSEREQLVVVEGNLWPDTAATAAIVSTLQEFRDLFSSEALAPGLQLGVENLAFMFTDLTGSTAMYQAIGQARAFRLVQDHFLVLRRAISSNRGAQVKTIGDAVMATFPGGADALAAAFQIQRDIRDLPAPAGVDTAHLVKVGLHQGPCVAVTLNNRLDYFGTTVNTAARIEHECRGGQIVASLAACQSETAANLLKASGARQEEEVVYLRGIAEPVPVYRITPSASP